MTRSEFLAGLREALENELGSTAVQNNMNYYDSYIRDEIQKGRSEEEVTAELGDPWVIARSIIDMAETAQEDQQTYSQRAESEADGGYSSERGKMHTFGLDAWWKKLALILCVVGVIVIIFAIIGGIFSLLMPILIPLIIVILLLRLIGGTRR